MAADETVALLGARDDPQMGAVEQALAEREVPTTIWDSRRWPGDLELSSEVGGDRERHAVGSELEGLAAVYVRNVGLDPRYDQFEGEFERRPYSLLNQLREYRGLLYSVLKRLEDRGVELVNPVRTSPYHDWKPWQLAALAEADLPVPETIATNDADAVEEFLERVDEAIYKPVAGGGYARPVTAETLEPERLERLANAPVQFQERLDGDNLRIFVVDGRVVAAGRIASDHLDYRTSEHDVEAIRLDSDLEGLSIRTADALGLTFTGVDVIDTGERRVVLEANPSPMFATFDELAGTEVGEHLAAYLAP